MKWKPGGAAGLFEPQDSYAIVPPTFASAPTAGVTYRGLPYRTEGATGVADTEVVVRKNSGDVYVNDQRAYKTREVVPTVSAYATPVVLTYADSGKIYLLNDAAGADFTLPAITSSTIGMVFDFRVMTTLSSNNYRMTAASGDLLFGHVWITDKDAATSDTNALISQFRPNGSSHLIVTIGGSADTTGRLQGGYLTFEALTATAWFVRGTLVGDGSIVTVFS